MKKLIRSQFGFLLYGFIFWLPIVLLAFILFYIFNYGEDLGSKAFNWFLPTELYHKGYGFLAEILVIYLSGVILKLTNIRKRLSKIPILGLFFGGGEVMTIDRLAHLTPCLFMMSPTCLSYGWILSEEQVKLDNSDTSFSLVNVYYPNVPTLITGQVFPIRRDSVIKLGNPSKEIIDLLLYAFRSPTAIKYLPWESEAADDFIRRAKAFGIQIIPAGWDQDDTLPPKNRNIKLDK